MLDTALGWVVRGREVLVRASPLIALQAPNLPLPDYLKGLWSKALPDRRRNVVWLPYGAGNYFHLINDFLGGLKLLSERYDLADWEVLTPPVVLRNPVFQEMVSLSTTLSKVSFTEYNPKRWITCDRLLSAGTSFSSWHTIQGARSLLDKLPRVSSAPPLDRIFLSRRGGVRTADNIDELAQALAERGFREVAFEGLPFVEQRDIINRAGMIVALHGAGIVNLGFHERPHAASLLEIAASNGIHPCYAFLTQEGGMNYQVLLCPPMDPVSGKFHVPVEAVLSLVENMLDARKGQSGAAVVTAVVK